MHDTGHPHEHPETGSENKVKAVLDYTAEHGKQHLEELKDLTTKLADDGKHEASKLLKDASELYEQAHEKIKEAFHKV